MSVRSFFRILSLLIGLVLIAGRPDAVTAQIYFDTAADSRLWLEGSSTVHTFDCVARSIQGTAYIEENSNASEDDTADTVAKDPENASRDQNTGGQIASTEAVVSGGTSENITDNPADAEADRLPGKSVRQSELHVHLKIPIISFDCGRSRMNRDMYDALKSDTYEFITFEFDDAQPISGDEPGNGIDEGYKSYRIEGVLNVAGVDRKVALTVLGRAEEQGRYRIKGQKEISMKDFEIEPPTALRGLIRAHDDLTVFFDLVVVKESP